MNVIAPRPRREPTQAAEGLPRWRWTLEEFERLIEVGILTEDDRVELIGGELVPMAAKGNRHENVKTALLNSINRRLDDDLWVAVELGWRPDNETYCEPDLLVFPAGAGQPSKVRPGDVRLLIEVAESSLRYDSSTKAPLYAHLGVRECWIINAATLETRVHREPSFEGYRHSERIAKSDLISPVFVPELAVRMADLRIS